MKTLSANHVAADIALGLKKLGPAIDPPATGALWRPLQQVVMGWLCQQRLEFSRARSVTEAAYGPGFSHLSHFSSSFRRACGTSPSALLRPH